MKIEILQHVPFEGPGAIGLWGSKNGHTLHVTSLYEKPVFPELHQFDLLVVMGGPMGIYDEDKYPWLKEEKAFLKTLIASRKLVLGICLGAQLIADVLGARVFKNDYKEIGWFPVYKQFQRRREDIFGEVPESLPVFHWHGDTFELPPGAVHLGASEGCVNQAFFYEEHVLALQFHFETTAESLKSLYTHCREEIEPGKYIQTEEDIFQGQQLYGARNNEILFRLLDKLLVYNEGMIRV